MPGERYDIVKTQLLSYSKARLVLGGDHRLEAIFQMNILRTQGSLEAPAGPDGDQPVHAFALLNFLEKSSVPMIGFIPTKINKM